MFAVLCSPRYSLCLLINPDILADGPARPAACTCTCKHELRCSHFLHLSEPESLICHQQSSSFSSPSPLPSTWTVRQVAAHKLPSNNAIKLKMKDTNDAIPHEFAHMPRPCLAMTSGKHVFLSVTSRRRPASVLSTSSPSTPSHRQRRRCPAPTPDPVSLRSLSLSALLALIHDPENRSALHARSERRVLDRGHTFRQEYAGRRERLSFKQTRSCSRWSLVREGSHSSAALFARRLESISTIINQSLFAMSPRI